MPGPKKADQALAQLVARAEKAVAHRHFTKAQRQKAIERLVLNLKLLKEAEARNAARGRSSNAKPKPTTAPQHERAKQRPKEPVQKAEQKHVPQKQHLQPEQVKPVATLPVHHQEPANAMGPVEAKPVSTAHQHLLDAHASLVARDSTLAREIERLEGLKQEREAIARQIEALQRALQVFEAGVAGSAAS